MNMITSGMRTGAFVVFADDDGLRHAVRLGSVLALCDADESRDRTLLMMPGSRIVLVGHPLDEVLSWFV